jgi:hypothetical protein
MAHSRARTTLRSKNCTRTITFLVRPDGSVLNKQEVLQDLRTNGLTFHSIELCQSKVRTYGPTAVLTGESRIVTSRNGREARAHF